MAKQYIDIPRFTSCGEIEARGFTLSASQYKTLDIPNKNLRYVAEFLDRELSRDDLGSEVGSDSYVEASEYGFIKTKALQPESFLPDINKESVQAVTPGNFVDFDLKKGDILISKDGNVGEAVILDEDYPSAMLCGGIYRLPVSKNKYYLLAFIKSELFRQQIDFLVPRGSTIRHGKKKFLECRIPMPSRNSEAVIEYVEALVKAIISKESEIRRKHRRILSLIRSELEKHQLDKRFGYSLPNVSDLERLDRMDSCLYSERFRREEFLINNYAFGSRTAEELGFEISRGQNLQISSIGRSIQTKEKRKGYYTLVLPKYLSKYGTVNEVQYLGNPNQLKTLKLGDVIFGAEGNEKGRSLAVIESRDMTITNIHGVTLNQNSGDVSKGIFVKLFLDYYRSRGMIDAYAVGGNGGSLAIKYWKLLRFPNFPDEKERELVKLYHNAESSYDPSTCGLKDFAAYDEEFNTDAGICELDSSMKYLKAKLDAVIDDIANDADVAICF